ncbi:bifunctional cytidylyltransferase/SDR family oxidoreductase [Sphingobacterium faecale]|uniref:2-C-methyl-D-erythritol 4-phosphate cytidylyltransferase n=1 Tax=Sphingobacterium faecale TaxID=2803775 RepID=A0ABS1QXV6_9SPHI|nr:bifunctional cytidylyltransferase/SDR family oxidoreductase [Sphingobacterium faecale]MBL1407268.1 bifunctional cytidylyltransferase/SDR family oxidoreductase [Sphingobacterium faecale]
MNVAVILAGGSGSRMASTMPKQFLKVAGKTIIEHTIDAFENNTSIDEIAIVTKENYISTMEELVLKNQYKKVKKILQGGKERYHSSLAAIGAYTDVECKLIFHDAVRPLVNDRIINDCIKALERYDAVDVAIQAVDTIIQVDAADTISDIPQRSVLRYGQTPQCFKRSVIQNAYELALQDPDFLTTDDCNVVKTYMPQVPIHVVEGEVFNMKVTHMEDLFLMDKLFQLKSSKGNAQELNKEAIATMPNKVMVVLGGSYGIGEEVVKIGRQLGAVVYSYSRTENGVDVSDVECVRKCLREVYERNGRIDYVVCTAGILIKEPLFSVSYDDLQKSISVNLMGTAIVAKEAYEYLKESKGGLLFYTSSSYTRGRMLYSVYSATKAAIVNFMQAISEEWFDLKIRVNCINPERTKTPMRIKNFGAEPEETLLNARNVGIATVNLLVSSSTGEVIDVKR